MLVELPIGEISFNPYNCRTKYASSSIERIAHSMQQSGQLASIRVRKSSSPERKYELVYGHRRLLAARFLGWNTIRAEVVEATDEQMISESLVENLEREGLSDYEKALIFERLNREFHRTYEEIGKLVGISKSHVSNYLAMLNLFTPETLAGNPELKEALQNISEHHSRVLSRISDYDTRINLTKLTVKNKLTVRELTNLLIRFRSWFVDSDRKESMELFDDASQPVDQEDREAISKVLLAEFQLAHKGDFRAFEELHLFDEGFTMYDDFPPFDRVEQSQARSKEREWFYKIAPNLQSAVEDLKIDFLRHVAVATLSVGYTGTFLLKP